VIVEPLARVRWLAAQPAALAERLFAGIPFRHGAEGWKQPVIKDRGANGEFTLVGRQDNPLDASRA
jgi:hypothetical protein